MGLRAPSTPQQEMIEYGTNVVGWRELLSNGRIGFHLEKPF